MSAVGGSKVFTELTVGEMAAHFRAEHQRGVAAFEGVWVRFFQAYLGSAEVLHVALLREMFGWFGDVGALRGRLFDVLRVQGYNGLTCQFLDDVFVVTPVVAARLGEEIKSLRGDLEGFVGVAVADEHVFAFHLLWGSLNRLRAAEVRLASNGFSADDAALIDDAALVRFFELAGGYLRLASSGVVS